MKKTIGIVCFIAVLFSGILRNTAFASVSDTSGVKASFKSSGSMVGVTIGTLATMKGGSFVICYDPSVVRYKTATEEWWAVSVEELEAGKIRLSFEDVVNSGTGLNASYHVWICFDWIGSGTPGFSVEDVKVYDKEGAAVPVEKEEQFKDFYVTAPDWEYNEETKTLTVRGTGFLCTELADKSVWDFCRQKIECIILGEGITGVDASYFSDFSALERVKIPLSTKLLDERAFPGSSSGIVENKFVIEGEAMTEAERFATACQYPFQPVSPVLLGDIDRDSHLTTDDALAILKMVAELTDCYGYTADVDEDGKVTTDDALCVLKNAAGIN